jgi:SET domain-containing protein
MIRVRIGTSRIHWQGLFAAQAIRKDTRIIEYTGEKIPRTECERRLVQGNVYIFWLNTRSAIDGKALTNLARYINHSCDPNCASDIIRGHIWILALRDIQDGEELTYDYGYGLEGYAHRPCTCGAKNCCGYILDQAYWGHITRKAQ